eukprot:SM000194S04806  [mRNA]  locus=s194:76177:79451:+ [translate_table: standard]
MHAAMAIPEPAKARAADGIGSALTPVPEPQQALSPPPLPPTDESQKAKVISLAIDEDPMAPSVAFVRMDSLKKIGRSAKKKETATGQVGSATGAVDIASERGEPVGATSPPKDKASPGGSADTGLQSNSKSGESYNSTHSQSSDRGSSRGWTMAKSYKREDSFGPASALMKGRITLFSTTDCPQGRAISSILKKKGATIIEVNVDHHPESIVELQRRYGKMSLPQVFFNDDFIGGYDAIQALKARNELDAKISAVFNTPVPPTAPAIPLPRTASLDSGRQDEFAELARELRHEVKIKDRWHKFRLYRNCFLGSDCVEWLSASQKCSRAQAVAMGNDMISRHFFHHVQREHGLRDGNSLYRFLEHNLPAGKQCINFNGLISPLQCRTAEQLGCGLRRLILAIYDEHSKGGRRVNYNTMAASEAFRRFVRSTEELQRLPLESLSRNEKMAFFVNIYNVLAIHATAVLGRFPENAAELEAFETQYCYIIGGSVYSLNDLEYGLLLGNKCSPYGSTKPFGSKDPRVELILIDEDPLIHCALFSGVKSSLSTKPFKAESVDEQLRLAATLYFENGGILITPRTKTVSVSRFFDCANVGAPDQVSVLRWLVQYLEAGQQRELLQLLKEEPARLKLEFYD